MEIRPVDASHDAVARIIRAHGAHSDAHYPAESNHHLALEDHVTRGIILLGAWDGDNLLGIVGLKALGDGHGEVKSMHVLDTARGRGVGASLVAAVIREAGERGFRRLSLETGSKAASAAARRLYARYGFETCPPFGPYGPDPNSVFMTRVID